MSATARLVVQMTPQEKRALDGRAKLAGVSISEFVRRRLNAVDDIGENRQEIEALLTALEASAPSVLHSVEAALASVAEISASLDALQSEARP